MRTEWNPRSGLVSTPGCVANWRIKEEVSVQSFFLGRHLAVLSCFINLDTFMFVGSSIAMPRTSYHIDKVSGKIQSTADGVWGVALRHSGVLMPCLKWTLSIGCINTVLRPSLSPGPFIYSCDPIRPQEVGVCSRDTTLRNRLTRDKSHYKS